MGKHVRLGFAVCCALLAAPAGDAQTPASTKAGEAYEGRQLQLRIVFDSKGLQTCVSIRATESGVYMAGLRSVGSFEDADGLTAKGTGFVPGMPPNPPPPWLEASYVLVTPGEPREECTSYPHSYFRADTFSAQVRYTSWLERGTPLPATLQKLVVEDKRYGRPLYADEILESNVCVIDRLAKQARCD